MGERFGKRRLAGGIQGGRAGRRAIVRRLRRQRRVVSARSGSPPMRHPDRELERHVHRPASGRQQVDLQDLAGSEGARSLHWQPELKQQIDPGVSEVVVGAHRKADRRRSEREAQPPVDRDVTRSDVPLASHGKDAGDRGRQVLHDADLAPHHEGRAVAEQVRTGRRASVELPYRGLANRLDQPASARWRVVAAGCRAVGRLPGRLLRDDRPRLDSDGDEERRGDPGHEGAS